MDAIIVLIVVLTAFKWSPDGIEVIEYQKGDDPVGIDEKGAAVALENGWAKLPDLMEVASELLVNESSLVADRSGDGVLLDPEGGLPDGSQAVLVADQSVEAQATKEASAKPVKSSKP
ncbi:hypothetical protein [Deefgea rivuli]|uniref:hypothetical protein n=1 Tax=Deefgea rivuli TaxID=400948 RepID=UPI000486A82F|nr:hypothetical protein [Deefgea rivuli]